MISEKKTKMNAIGKGSMGNGGINRPKEAMWEWERTGKVTGEGTKRGG